MRTQSVYGRVTLLCGFLFGTLLCVTGCANTSTPDPLAFATLQTEIPYDLVHPEFGDLKPYIATAGMWVDPQITAICRDDWVSYSQRRSGTCAGHRGVKTWKKRPSR